MEGMELWKVRPVWRKESGNIKILFPGLKRTSAGHLPWGLEGSQSVSRLPAGHKISNKGRRPAILPFSNLYVYRRSSWSTKLRNKRSPKCPELTSKKACNDNEKLSMFDNLICFLQNAKRSPHHSETLLFVSLSCPRKIVFVLPSNLSSCLRLIQLQPISVVLGKLNKIPHI